MCNIYNCKNCNLYRKQSCGRQGGQHIKDEPWFRKYGLNVETDRCNNRTHKRGEELKQNNVATIGLYSYTCHCGGEVIFKKEAEHYKTAQHITYVELLKMKRA